MLLCVEPQMGCPRASISQSGMILSDLMLSFNFMSRSMAMGRAVSLGRLAAINLITFQVHWRAAAALDTDFNAGRLR